MIAAFCIVPHLRPLLIAKGIAACSHQCATVFGGVAGSAAVKSMTYVEL